MPPPGDIDDRIQSQLELFRNSKRAPLAPESTNSSTESDTHCSQDEFAAASEQLDSLRIADAAPRQPTKDGDVSSPSSRIADDAQNETSQSSSPEEDDDEGLQSPIAATPTMSFAATNLHWRATPAPIRSPAEVQNFIRSAALSIDIRGSMDKNCIWLTSDTEAARDQLVRKYIKNLSIVWRTPFEGELAFNAGVESAEFKMKLRGNLYLPSVGLEFREDLAKDLVQSALLCLRIKWEEPENGWVKFAAEN